MRYATITIGWHCVGFRAACNCQRYRSNQHRTPERAAEAGWQHVRAKHHGHVVVVRYPAEGSR